MVQFKQSFYGCVVALGLKVQHSSTIIPLHLSPLLNTIQLQLQNSSLCNTTTREALASYKMPTTLGIRNLHMCFTKIKQPVLSDPNPHDHAPPFPSTILIKNFNSLYDYNNSLSTPSSSSTLSCDTDSDSEPDFATVVASQRFFFTSPGSSNSIIESSPSIATTLETSDTPVSMISPSSDQSSNNLLSEESQKSWDSPSVKDSVAVPTYSPDPYMDFRRSMQEMVEARDLVDVKSNWDYLHELLLCYLALNPKSTHKFIIGAFADLLVSLMSPPETETGGGRRR